MKSVVKAEGCQRQALYNHFTDLITPLLPGHLCCSNCRQQCVCDGEKCSGITEVFMPVADEPEEELPGAIRTLTPEDENDLKLALVELQSKFSATGASFFEPTVSHGFTEQLVDDIVENAANIFTFDYLRNNFSIYSTQHIMDVLEVLQELFEDIPDYEQQMEMLGSLNNEVTRAEEYIQAMEVQSTEDISDDSDDDFSLPEFDLRF